MGAAKGRAVVERKRTGVSRVVQTTVGELVAAAVETLGPAQAARLFQARSPLQRLLRQRLVVES